MADRASLATTLTDTLHLHRPPIAVSFTDTIPDGVRTWEGSVPAGCRFWQEAAKSVFATTAKHHDGYVIREGDDAAWGFQQALDHLRRAMHGANPVR